VAGSVFNKFITHRGADKNTLTAAVELSSAGIGNLETDVKNLTKTYVGLTGELGETIPFLRTLTKEQLSAGVAIDVVKEKHAGFAKTLAQNTMEGKIDLAAL
jgi:hypothetical protein